MREARSLPITDFLWRGGELLDGVDLLAPPEPGAALREIAGQFALHQVGAGGEHVLARDRLGVNKLFFSVREDGEVESSNYLIDLVRRGHRLEAVWSVPSGHTLILDPEKKSLGLRRHSSLDFGGDGGSTGDAIRERAAVIRERLESTFEMLRPAVAGRPVYVTMSGGLDSSIIALLAREWLGGVTGVTFRVDDAPWRGELRDDLYHAQEVARFLDIRLRIIQLSPAEVVQRLDTVLLHGQDWREFNVHCGLVNAAIGAAIREWHAADPDSPAPIVLTGDTMNELMADYAPVHYAGVEHYPLPRMPAAKLRRFLVGGLDSGDREIGIFAHYGIRAIQPYALCADAYAALPGGLIEEPRAKQLLAREVLGSKLPSCVYDRKKVRAQFASAESPGGTFLACVGNGISQDELARRFAELFEAGRMPLTSLIRAGFYRFPSKYPTGAHVS